MTDTKTKKKKHIMLKSIHSSLRSESKIYHTARFELNIILMRNSKGFYFLINSVFKCLKYVLRKGKQ